MAVPREVFPLAAVLTATFDLLMSGLVLTGMMVWFQLPVGWPWLWVPVLLFMTGALAMGIGMFLAALGTFRRDFLLARGFFMQLWLYVSPIIYPISSVPERWRGLYVMNPMVGILEGFRAVLVKGVAPDPDMLGWSLVGIMVAWIAGWPLYRYMSQYFADAL